MFVVIAMEICTCEVEIRSTTIPLASRMENIFSKNPCETDLRFEMTFKTITPSFSVAAVGCLDCVSITASCESTYFSLFLSVLTDGE